MIEATDVLLINMPFGPLYSPSIGLSLLKSGLTRESIKAKVLYFNLSFAALIGIDLYERFGDDAPGTSLVCEWVFSQSLFGRKSPAEITQFINDILRCGNADLVDDMLRPLVEDEFIEEILKACSLVDGFLEDCLCEVAAYRPRVVGFTSVFQQQVAALSLGRRIKERLPDVAVVFGGGNCEGVMGRELFRRFSFIDVVVSGEGDLVFPGIVQNILLDLPLNQSPGVYARRRTGLQVLDTTPTHTPIVENLDALPVPDYDDYFSQLKLHFQTEPPNCTILVETSRGCWWGAKHHCTFCGLNGGTMSYRSKTPERAIAELTTLSEQYPGRDIGVVDNILDMKYFENFIPYLAERRLGVNVSYEVKANLTKEQLASLKNAGITAIQPGIESLSDNVLTIMKKGVRAIQNIQLLKWCAELDIHAAWNFLWGFPDEPADDYKEMSALVQLITHLTPPYAIGKIRTDRFSPNFDRAEELGFKNLRPYTAYSHVYKLPPEAIDNLAFSFTYEYARPSEDPGSYIRPLIERVKEWSECHGSSKLFSTEKGEYLFIWDTRPIATTPLTVLSGLPRQCYQICDRALSLESLHHEVKKTTDMPISLAEINACLDDLLEKSLLLRHGNAYLSLAVPRSLRSAPQTEG